MKVYFIGAGPGDPELITVKGKKRLEKAGIIIYAGSLVNPALLDYNPAAEVYNSAELTLDEIFKIIKQAAQQGIDVVRLQTGDPSLYGALKEQLDLLIENEIPFEIIPGVSSFLAAAAVLAREYTLPELSQTVILTRQAGRTAVPEREKLADLAAHRASMAIFLSVQLIDQVVKNLHNHYPLTTPTAVVSRASWPDQEIIRGTLANIVEKVTAAGIKKTALILVGEFLANNSPNSKLYAANFSHEYRQPTAEKKAILVVSFGTSYAQTRTKTIAACEKRIAAAYPDYQVKRAFTSEMIINKLKARDKIEIDNPEQALNKLYRAGYQEIIVQPLHIINGSEFHDLARAVNNYQHKFRKIKLGQALLTTTNDYFELAEIIKNKINLVPGEAAILMGHGSEHPANSVYSAFDYVLKDKIAANYHVATVEAYPALTDVLPKLKFSAKQKISKVKLIPLMLVAGDHVQNDMAGEGPDSWINIVQQNGFEVECYLTGLGEYEAVQKKYLAKVAALITETVE